MKPRAATAGFALAACFLFAAGALAQATDLREMEQRLERIERLLDAEGLVQLIDDVKSQEVAIRELRGRLEELSHKISQLQQRQRELYLDIDHRLQRLEAGGPSRATAPSAQPAVGSETPAAPEAPAAQTPGTGAVATDQPAAAPAADVTTPAQPATGVDPFAEQQAYQGAFELLKSGRYEDAAEAFRRFIAAYPAGSYADNALYWLGETYYITRNFELAIREFQRLLASFPDSGKLTHAMLKIGYAHDELGNRAEAEQALGDLVARFPQSAAAGLARRRLQNIRQ